MDKGAHMYGKKQRPSWWLLYLSLPVMIGLFVIEMRLSLSDAGHQLAQIIIVLVIFGFIWVWLNANTGAIIQEDLEKWRAASRLDSISKSHQYIKVIRANGNLNPRLHQEWGSIFRRLAGWASAVSTLFHFRGS
jgi:hypothetical protein